MAWWLRLGVFVILLLSIGAGSWVIAIVCAAYLYYGTRRRRSSQGTRERLVPDVPRNLPLLPVAGASLLTLASAAYLEGGRSSPLAIGAAGAILLGWPLIKSSELFMKLTPVPETILLRWKVIPIRWTALVELKPTSGKYESLSLPGESILIDSTVNPKVFSILTTYSLTLRSAEARILGLVREQASSAAERGVYCLPLSSETSGALLRLRRSSRRASDLLASASKAGNRIFAMHLSGDFVTGATDYLRPTDRSQSPISPIGRMLSIRPLVREVTLSLFGPERSEPDAETVFLSSMHATRGEPLDQRLKIEPKDDVSLWVDAPGSERVSLTRTQLRAIATIYA